MNEDLFYILAYLNKPKSSFVDSTNAVSVTQGKPKISTVSVSYSAGAGSRRSSSLRRGNSHICYNFVYFFLGLLLPLVKWGKVAFHFLFSRHQDLTFERKSTEVCVIRAFLQLLRIIQRVAEDSFHWDIGITVVGKTCFTKDSDSTVSESLRQHSHWGRVLQWGPPLFQSSRSMEDELESYHRSCQRRMEKLEG